MSRNEEIMIARMKEKILELEWGCSCPFCGSPHDPSDTYCSQCGRRLRLKDKPIVRVVRLFTNT